MSPKDSSKDPERMVMATAKAMALAEHSCGTPRMVKLYVDDARQVLLDIAKAGKRDKWSFDELVVALDPPKPKENRRERHEGPPLRGEP